MLIFWHISFHIGWYSYQYKCQKSNCICIITYLSNEFIYYYLHMHYMLCQHFKSFIAFTLSIWSLWISFNVVCAIDTICVPKAVILPSLTFNLVNNFFIPFWRAEYFLWFTKAFTPSNKILASVLTNLLYLPCGCGSTLLLLNFGITAGTSSSSIWLISLWYCWSLVLYLYRVAPKGNIHHIALLY